MLLAAALLWTALAQDPVPAGPPASPSPAPAVAEDDWITINFVAVQAGDRVVTLRDYEQMVERVANANQLTPDNPDYVVMAGQLLRDVSMSELEPQAGRDLGIAPEQVERIIAGQIDESRREIGTAGLADVLAEDGLSLQGLRESRQSSLFRQIWRQDNLGSKTLPLRPRRDNYVRPGAIRSIYRSNRDVLNPLVITLQVIQAPLVYYAGDEEGGRLYLEEARVKALEGADFNRLVQEYSVLGQSEQGFLPPIPIDQVRFAELREWARTAPEGAIGPVMAVDEGENRSLLLPRMHVREGGDPPVYTDPSTQEDLRKRADRVRREQILTFERGRLMQSSFVWIDPNLRFLLNRAPAPNPGS